VRALLSSNAFDDRSGVGSDGGTAFSFARWTKTIKMMMSEERQTHVIGMRAMFSHPGSCSKPIVWVR